MKRIACLVFTFLITNSLFAQYQPTLPDTLKWIKEKIEDPVAGSPQRDFSDGKRLQWSITIETTSFDYDDTKITFMYKGECQHDNKYGRTVETPIYYKIQFKLEDVKISGTDDYWGKGSDLKTLTGGGAINTFTIDFTCIDTVASIEQEYTEWSYSEPFSTYIVKDKKGSFFILFTSRSLRDRALVAFENAIKLAQQKYPPKKEIF